ncbi:dihydroxyacetone kinase family protein [Agromyces archimandritae]|uniref:Dihydroxyacetone kinase family protein n=1 Tax=Agromyces archimandritae TaxID=2781962 RepID=A0A975FPT8_9MICO|nr:dihydroxyacetone kinase family protein [Agromyces archimandritae]QTX04966.1 dihydroxyacetone kinase family protein [Agromyces archimandritae]
MSYVINDPTDFAEEAAAGFVAAHRSLVRRVPGGVARAGATPAGQVAVVIGGGSGHYPAFAGLVGPGLAHGAAMGDVFASPSAHRVHGVARAVASDAGVLLSYGNYAGDVLNFDAAEAQLHAEGIPCRTVRVTDDIFSAGREEREKRRGIAGDLTVFRAASWAAEAGHDLDGVFDLASHANERTRSLGVAFSGCTLPGAGEPLFTVPAGQMGVGMGIHGEPGIDIRPRPSADELGRMFVAELLAERPDDVPDARGARVAVVLNGLGAVKSEELFVIYGTVARELEAAGVVIVDPEVGEYATSFEMAGVSLTLFWLDDELERAWSSPAYAPAYRKGVVDAAAAAATEALDADTAEALDEDEPLIVAAGSEASIAAAGTVRRILDALRETLDAEADALGRLDAIAGDGDHGIGMQRGSRAAAAAAGHGQLAIAGAGTVLARAGDAWADQGGGTSGALWGAGLRAAGLRIGDAEAPDASAVAAAVDAARAVVQSAGKAEPGDKTLVDALVPFAESLRRRIDAGETLAAAWDGAAQDAQTAADATALLVPRLGRARPHAAKSVGTPDPGAISFALAMNAAARVLAARVLADKEET